MRAFVIVVFAFGCGARTAVDQDRVGSGSDSGVDSGGSPGADAGVVNDAGTDVDAGVDRPRCLDPTEMPPDGPIGDACEVDADCEDGLVCTDLLGGPNFCSASCDADTLSGCPVGGLCAGGFGFGYAWCFDECIVSERNPLAETACGCAPGETCGGGICFPGCTSDDACCGLEDLRPEDAKVRTCTSTCSAASSRCVHPSAPGSRIGGPCLLSDECPTEAWCDPFDWTPVIAGVRHPIAGLCHGICGAPPGYPDVCAGVDGAVCVAESVFDVLVGQCLEACSPGGEACSRAGFVCYAGGAGDVGYCWPSCREYGGDTFCAIRGAGRCEPDGHCSGP